MIYVIESGCEIKVGNHNGHRSTWNKHTLRRAIVLTRFESFSWGKYIFRDGPPGRQWVICADQDKVKAYGEGWFVCGTCGASQAIPLETDDPWRDCQKCSPTTQ